MKKQEFAHTIALQAVSWIANESDMLRHFLAATGLSEQDMRDGLGNPDLLAAVMDFLLMDDRWILDCAQFVGVTPEEFVSARQHLPGGEIPHWT